MERATSDQTGVAHYSVSANGTLAYIKNSLFAPARTLVWVDRATGNEEALAIEPSSYAYPRISPDGSRIALDDRNPSDDLWIFDLRSGTRTRLSVDGQGGAYPVWTQDASRIAYSVGNPAPAIYWRPANSAAAATPLATDFVKRDDQERRPRTYFFTPSADRIVFAGRTEETNDDIGSVAVGGGEAKWLLEDRYNELNAELSPNGRWMAYQSDESGEWEIYVRPFPDVGSDRIQVSNAGGFKPLWSRDGRELFYLEDRSPSSLTSVAIEPSEREFAFGERTRIMAWPYDLNQEGRTYDVAADGQRFLAVKQDPSPADDWIVVVQNWFDELRARVPSQ